MIYLMVFETRIKGCADLARTTYLDRMENQLIFLFTFYYAYKPFPNSAEQTKWMMSYILISAVMIEIKDWNYQKLTKETDIVR
jgi:hypothetical protein